MKLRSLFLVAGAVVLTGVSLFAAGPTYPKNVIKEPTKTPAVSRDAKPASPLDFTVQDINGKDVNLSQYKGKVVMIVNVASKCGYTPQYEQLEAVYKKYADKGLMILGFPANNFMGQEPGTNQQIQEFCTSKYGVTFPMMSKISVVGTDKAPLYQFLTEKQTAGDFAGEIGWN